MSDPDGPTFGLRGAAASGVVHAGGSDADLKPRVREQGRQRQRERDMLPSLCRTQLVTERLAVRISHGRPEYTSEMIGMSLDPVPR